MKIIYIALSQSSIKITFLRPYSHASKRRWLLFRICVFIFQLSFGLRRFGKSVRFCNIENKFQIDRTQMWSNFLLWNLGFCIRKSARWGSKQRFQHLVINYSRTKIIWINRTFSETKTPKPSRGEEVERRSLILKQIV